MQSTTARLLTWQIMFCIVALGIRDSCLQCSFTDRFLISQDPKKKKKRLSMFVLGLLSQDFLYFRSFSYDLKETFVFPSKRTRQQAWDHPQLVPLFCFLPLNLVFTKRSVPKEGECKPADAIIPGIDFCSSCKISGKYMASSASPVAQTSTHYYCLLYPLLCSFIEAESSIIMLIQLFWLFL